MIDKKQIAEAAAARHAEGWKAKDREDLIFDYELTDEQADAICAELERLEAEDAAVLAKVVKIAQRYIMDVNARGDLETRHSDGEDFLDVSVWSLRDALVAAYELGRKEAKQ